MNNKVKRRYTLLPAFVLFVFFILLIGLMISGAIVFGLYQFSPFFQGPGVASVILTLLITSVLLCTSFAAVFGRKPLRPFRNLTKATQEIAAGNFNVRVNVRGPVEMQELAIGFNRMAEELGSIETLRTDFVNNVSHEFKTPVVSIRGFAKLLKKDTISPESREEYLDIIIQESDRLSQLAENILLLSRLDRQELVQKDVDFSLDEQIRQAILLLEPQWKKKQLQLTVELEQTRFFGNEELLKQAWINIISNSIKFTPAGGTIEVRLRQNPDCVTVTIADSGVGMNKEVRAHLFDKFYQGDKSRSVEGNGLGLSLVKRIVDLSGGTIQVESRPGQGTMFTVELPGSPMAPAAEA